MTGYEKISSRSCYVKLVQVRLSKDMKKSDQLRSASGRSRSVQVRSDQDQVKPRSGQVKLR